MSNGVPGFLGRVLVAGAPVGTCFQVAPGVLVTAWHVLDEARAPRVGDSVEVDGLAACGAPARTAQVVAVDPVHDLSVLRRSEALPECEERLEATDAQRIRTDVVMTGHSVVADEPGWDTRHLDAPGWWAGTTTRGDAIPLGRVTSHDVVPGMSGAPVRRLSDGVIVGVVSGRYNSADGWLRDTVWVARVEDLAALLAEVPAAAEVVRLSPGPRALREAADLVLTVTRSQVRLRGAGVDICADHSGIAGGLGNAVDDVRRARARSAGHRADPGTSREADDAPGRLLREAVGLRRVGELLGESFLPAPVAAELARVLEAAAAGGMPLRLGVQADGAYARLPWEALPDPVGGGPLALHRLVTVFRQVAAPEPRRLGGPLRIVVAIAAPTTGGGGVLDYERELRSVLAAVRGARAGLAVVDIVPFATTAAIHQALRGGDVHVLHLSGHGGPGVLELEDEEGVARAVTPQQFLREAVPAGCMPAVISLAACYTAAPAADEAPSFAADLLAHGASAVIATETSITDRFATRVFARLYGELAQSADVVAAAARVRRLVQDELAASPDPRDRAVSGLGEWAVLTIHAPNPVVTVLDPTAPPGPVIEQPAQRTFAGLLARDPGQFVGRRFEQRMLPAVLSGGSVSGTNYHGVLLRGIGGIGKTTLAAEAVRRTIERQPRRLVATVTGQVSVDDVLAAVIAPLRRHLMMARQTSSVAWQAVEMAGRLDLRWDERWGLLREHVLDTLPVLVVLDNFEDNLTDPASADQPREVRDPALAELLAEWSGSPGASRLLITCRYPFTLPNQAQQHLLSRPVGPLSQAETHKLIWALPALDALDDQEVDRIWRAVGGHPRTLEYVDALLGRGHARFTDITMRLEAQLQVKLGDRARQWLSAERTLDTALAEAATLAADDVVLPELVATIVDIPGAERALLGLSVYREPVDENALLFQVGDDDPAAGWIPDRKAAAERIATTLANHGLSQEVLDRALQAQDLESLPSAAVRSLLPDLQERYSPPRPPRSTQVELAGVIDGLAGSTLLSVDSNLPGLYVHRWTAGELARLWQRAGRDHELQHAHRGAAEYWRWRVGVWPQDRRADVHDLLEARYHHLQAGDLDPANEATEAAAMQLQDWGAWDGASALARDMLNRFPAGHPRESAYLHQLGMLAQLRGEYGEAERL
ncbi:MAG: CHAT domain-containing protein, partial [Candidatus Nanopelagicales bacterium]